MVQRLQVTATCRSVQATVSAVMHVVTFVHIPTTDTDVRGCPRRVSYVVEECSRRRSYAGDMATSV